MRFRVPLKEPAGFSPAERTLDGALDRVAFEAEPQTAAFSGAESPELGPRIEALLRLPLKRLVLPDDILALYNDQAGKGGRKMMASWCWWIALLNIPSALVDVLTLPRGLLPLDFASRGLISLMFAAAAWLLGRGRLRGRESLVIMLLCLASILLSGVIGLRAHEEAQLDQRLIFSVVLTFSAIMILSLDRADLRLLGLASIVLTAMMFALAGPAHGRDNFQLLFFFAIEMLALLRARDVQNLYHYRLFLLKLRDDLQNAAASRRNEQLSSIAYVDPLTELPNRRYFDEICASINNDTKNLLPLSLCLLDVDHFKNLNDRLGHLQGDRCLRVIAAAIRNNLRGASDILARYGGEEFVLLLPATEAAEAAAVAERIRVAILTLAHPNPATPRGIVSISIGIAVALSRPVLVEQLINDADRAMYEAKKAGRNRVRLQGEWLPDGA
jgi:diguanylate cyclase (GGDEF)-like protein